MTIETSSWWSNLTRKARLAYIKAHPNSKYAQRVAKKVKRLDDDINRHDRRQKFHDGEANKLKKVFTNSLKSVEARNAARKLRKRREKYIGS